MNQTPIIIYTNHQSTIQILKSVIPNAEVVIPNRSVSPVEEISSRYQPGVAVIGVMPLDAAVELHYRGYKIFLTRLDGSVIERLTNKPYDPKIDYPQEVVKEALVIQKIVKAEIRYMSLDEFLNEINGKTVVVFNDDMRKALQILARERGIEARFIKEGQGDTRVGLPPTMAKGEGYQISFPSTAGRLTANEMAEMIKYNKARIYWVSIDSEIIPLDSLPQHL